MYTSHHPVLHQFSRLKVITRGLNDVWDADLMDMSKFARHNDGIHYVAIFIDIFSRYLYTEPMKNKMTKTTLNAIKQVFQRSKVQPKTFDQMQEMNLQEKKFINF